MPTTNGFTESSRSSLKPALLAAALSLLLPMLVGAHDESKAAPRREAVFKDGINGVFEAFATHPLVGLGDRHGLAQGFIFYENLVSDPRFARDIGNVVVEFGGASHQAVIDRYVNGEPVPYAELRRVWTDTAGWIPIPESAYFAHFFFQLRETNRALPSDKRIKVWLGDPPIDWSKINTNEEWRQIARTRQPHAADVVVKNILAKNRKALLIFGAQWFAPMNARERAVFAEWEKVDPTTFATIPRNIQKLVEQNHPDTFFVAQIYIGFGDTSCTADFERGLTSLEGQPKLATPVRGTVLESDVRKCLPPIQRAGRTVPPEWPRFVHEYLSTQVGDPVLLEGDAILFLGPSEKLTQSPRLQELYLDDEYRQEIARRLKIMVGQELSAFYGRSPPPPSLAYTARDRGE
jgi:hypothetical protein